MNTLAPALTGLDTWSVRHFTVEHVGMLQKNGVDWDVYTVTDQRVLPASRQVDKVRTYAVRQLAPGSWVLVNKDNRNHYHVAAVADFLTCDCPAGQRPPRHSTTTSVNALHGSCVHRDVIATHQARLQALEIEEAHTILATARNRGILAPLAVA